MKEPYKYKSWSEETDAIRASYERVERALKASGKLLRTTVAGNYMWAARHNTALSGLRATMEIIKQDVPYYDSQ